MPQHILYAYVEGDDLALIADNLEQRFKAFVAARTWAGPVPTVVNHRVAPTPGNPGDLAADWDLGLNLPLPDPGTETAGWFADVAAIARFLGELNAATRQDFIIGTRDSRAGWAEDLFTVDSPIPDIDRLKTILGVGAVV